MEEKIKVGVLGATGMIGQNYISLLNGHPWFEVSYVAASPQSEGKKYKNAVAGRWHMQEDIPDSIKNMVVGNANNVEQALNNCSFVFSALEMDKEAIKKLEIEYAKAGFPVVSNASAHRWTEDIPMIIPEINSNHIEIIQLQKEHYGFDRGFIVVKPNCSLQSYMTPVHALREAEQEVEKMIITTLQAVSGAGHPGVSSFDIIDNVIPYIAGEEEKTEKEPLKIFGNIDYNRKVIENNNKILISAHCNRVPVIDGHMACVSLAFSKNPPSLEEVIKIWENFKALPQELKLPFAPEHPIIYREEIDRPQPRLDRDVDKGMAVSVGRLRKCNVFDIRFTALSHNTIRGAAGGAIETAELLKAKGYLG